MESPEPDLDSTNAEVETALMLVARTGKVDAVKLLLEARANVTAAAPPRRLYAARESCVEAAQALVEGGADPNLTDPGSLPGR